MSFPAPGHHGRPGPESGTERAPNTFIKIVFPLLAVVEVYPAGTAMTRNQTNLPGSHENASPKRAKKKKIQNTRLLTCSTALGLFHM